MVVNVALHFTALIPSFADASTFTEKLLPGIFALGTGDVISTKIGFVGGNAETTTTTEAVDLTPRAFVTA